MKRNSGSTRFVEAPSTNSFVIRTFSVLLFVSLSVSGLVACTPQHSDGGTSSLSSRWETESQLSKQRTQEGGVDVGNYKSYVPGTFIAFKHPGSWKAVQNANLVLSNNSGSRITSRQAKLPGVSDPTSVDLARELGQRNAGTTYKEIQLNGLLGARADIEKSADRVRSDIWLVSPSKEIIQIKLDLKAEDRGIENGNAILETVRLEYKGVATPNAPIERVTLKYNDRTAFDRDPSFTPRPQLHSLLPRNQRGVNGVSVGFGYYGYGDQETLIVGLAGNDGGRFLEIGHESAVPFEDVRIEGKYLVAPKSPLKASLELSDLYSAFSPARPMVKADQITLKEGAVYLLRTISWPDEDILWKIKVEKLTPGDSVTLVYQKLAEVPVAELKAIIDAMNEKTLNEEMKHDSGIVTLYSRYNWGDYVSATFNFQYATRDNVYIVRNDWDLLYEGRDDLRYLEAGLVGGTRSLILDLGTNKKIEDITKADFPDLMTTSDRPQVSASPGHTYLILGLNEDRFVYAAIEVLEVGPENAWMRMKWRRIEVSQPFHFQRWTETPVDNTVKSLSLDGAKGWRSQNFYPAVDRRAGEYTSSGNSAPIELMNDDSTGPYLYIDTRWFPRESGFVRLPKGTPLEAITIETANALNGSFKRETGPLKAGTVYIAVLENLYEKSIVAFEIVSATPPTSAQPYPRVNLRYKRLFVGQTNPK